VASEPLELTDFERQLIRCLDSAHGQVLWAAGNAIAHLHKAWRLREFDSEMAVFRAITAEEEMATALIVAAQELQYANAARLKRRSHLHKLGLYPFLTLVRQFFASLNPPPEITFRINDLSTSPWLTLLVNSPVGWIESKPPLNFAIRAESTGSRPYDFRHELREHLESKGAQTLRDQLQPLVQLRNRILYASYEGRPGIAGDIAATIQWSRRRVFALLRALCLVFPHRERALFVQQVTDAFLIAVEQINPDDLSTS